MKNKIRLIAGAVALAISTLGGAIAFGINNANEASLNAAEGTQWSGLNTTGSLFGNSFRSALQTKINASGSLTVGYTSLWDYLALSDAWSGDSTKIRSFYVDPALSSSTYFIAATNSGGSKGQWNKEHVWPNSRGVGTSGPGADPQMLRAAAVSLNGSRGNLMYAASGAYDPASSGYAAARGEAARIIFYEATRYYSGSYNLELTNNTSDSTSNNTMGKLSDLLDWNNQYPVTEAETRRNNVLNGTYTFARNPFIDHPDYANYIWDANGIRSSAYTPGSLISYSSTSSSGSSSSKSTSSSSSTPSSSSSVSSSSSRTFQLVTSSSDLTVGSNYIISSTANGTGYAAQAALTNNYYLAQVAVTATSNVIPYVSNLGVFTLESGTASGKYAFHDSASSSAGYIRSYSTSGTSKTYYDLGFASSTSAETNWTITVGTGGAAILLADNGEFIEYYSSKGSFSAYGTSSTVYLFKEVSSGSKTVNSLEQSGSPSTTTYTAGQSFDPTGLTITASYSDGTSADVTSLMTWTPSPLTAGTTSVTGTYQGLTVTITGLTVNAAAVTLSSISVTTEPTKGTYTVGDTLDTTGLVITATYSDDSTQVISSGYTLSPANGSVLSTAGSQTITVTYSGKTTTFSVTVNAASVGGTKTITAASTNMPTSYPSGKSVSLEGIQMTLTNIGTFDGKKTIQFKSTNSSKMYNTSDDGTITSIVISGSEAVDLTVYCGSSSNPTATTISPTVSGTTYTYTFPAGMDYFSIVGSSSNTINVTSIAINYAASGDGATTFATAFLSALSTACTDGQNNSTPSSALVTAWANEYTAWQALASADQTTLTSATANMSGTSIQQAVARYDYILSKYGTSAFDSGNYMGRTIASSGAKANVLVKDDTGLILLASTLIMASLACGFYFLRKKRA
jgi:hypothetical protein